MHLTNKMPEAHNGFVESAAAETAGAPVAEIEITKEMVSAGAKQLRVPIIMDLMDGCLSPQAVAADVFRAMLSVYRECVR